MTRLRRALRRLVCRVRGHLPPYDPPTLIERLSVGLMGRRCRRCHERMPGDPPTPIERMMEGLAVPLTVFQPAGPITGGAIVYQDPTGKEPTP